MNVVENLYEYLKHNTNAEIPGLGTFSVKTSSAQINESAGTIIPPSRKVVFEKKLEGNKDFISFMSKREFISLETSETWIKQYSDSLINKLSKGETIKLDKLGTLKQGYVGEYTFTPEDNLNLMDDVFALGELKHIKTYRAENEKIDLIHTKTTPITEPIEKIEQTEQENIAKTIAESETINTENRIQETQQETQDRISQHEEIKVDSPTPINAGEEVEPLSVDIALNNEAEESTPIKEETKAQENPEETQQPEQVEEEKKEETIDDLQKEAMAILDKYNHPSEKGKKKKKKQKDGKKKRKIWFIIFWIVLALLLLCAGFVGAHYMGWLKDVSFLKPVTDKLSYYIPVREVTKAKPVAQPIVTPTQEENEPIEVSPTEVLKEEVLNHEGLNAAPTNRNQTVKTTKPTPKQKTQETKTKEPEAPVVDNSPVLVQNHSKLGFDVVGGTFDSKQKAEVGARKARSLGYDGYVISKIKNGNPIYYVSYGSRRTFKEATDLMQGMVNKMGGSYYVMSR